MKDKIKNSCLRYLCVRVFSWVIDSFIPVKYACINKMGNLCLKVDHHSVIFWMINRTLLPRLKYLKKSRTACKKVPFCSLTASLLSQCNNTKPFGKMAVASSITRQMEPRPIGIEYLLHCTNFQTSSNTSLARNLG